MVKPNRYLPHIPDWFLTSYRNIIESTTGMCCPNILGVRVPNNGAILTAAIGHQIVHVALPRHAEEKGVLDILKKNTKDLEARSPDERQTRQRREFRVSNESPTSTLTNVKAGAAMRRLGVVPIRSLRTMSARRFYGSGRRNKGADPPGRSRLKACRSRTSIYQSRGFLFHTFHSLNSSPC